MAKGLLVCGHGSRKQLGVDRFIGFANHILKRHPSYIGGYAFMELSEPDFASGIKKLYDKGAREIIALPAFLFSGVHMKHDIPSMLKSFEKQYEGLTIKLASYIGTNQKLIDLAKIRIEEAEATLDSTYSRDNACLISVAVGTSMPEANGDIANVAYQLWEQTRFGYSAPAYVNKLAFPSLKNILEVASALPQQYIVLQIMILFEGIYHDIIRQQVKKIEKRSGKTFILTEPLGYDELIYQALDLRLQEVEQGTVDLCSGINADSTCHHHHHHGHSHGHNH